MSGGLRRWKMGNSALMLVTLSDGEASCWLSSGYLKRQFKILVGIEKEKERGGKQSK